MVRSLLHSTVCRRLAFGNPFKKYLCRIPIPVNIINRDFSTPLPGVQDNVPVVYAKSTGARPFSMVSFSNTVRKTRGRRTWNVWAILWARRIKYPRLPRGAPRTICIRILLAAANYDTVRSRTWPLPVRYRSKSNLGNYTSS
jgi:hypothetical protein